MTTPFSVPVKELAYNNFFDKRKTAPGKHLHYCPPSTGCWGIIRVGLLVPQSVLLFVSPAACGRHGAIAGIQLGFKNRLFFLNINEVDIVSGEYLNRIDTAVGELLDELFPTPKAVLICSTCIDDLLASDYQQIAVRLEMKYKTPIRSCKMDPIASETKLPPHATIHNAIYDFISVSSDKNPAINIIGNFAILDKKCELPEVLSKACVTQINHIAGFANLDDFMRMGKAVLNVVIKPVGKLAAIEMEKKHSIPYCYAPVSYSLDAIKRNYETIEKSLGVHLDITRYYENAKQEIKKYKDLIGDISIAVGESINASAFELSRALVEYGFTVKYIFADVILDTDQEHIDYLNAKNSDIRVFTNSHPTMSDFINDTYFVDVAIGFDAGYFCSRTKTVPLSVDEQLYGFAGVTTLMATIYTALNCTQDFREQMYESGMVI